MLAIKQTLTLIYSVRSTTIAHDRRSALPAVLKDPSTRILASFIVNSFCIGSQVGRFLLRMPFVGLANPVPLQAQKAFLSPMPIHTVEEHQEPSEMLSN